MEFDEECTLRRISYLPSVDPVSSLKNSSKHLFLKHLEIRIFRDQARDVREITGDLKSYVF
jgi:hypothetical protein